MDALTADFPNAVGDRLAAYQEAISSQRTIARPTAVLTSPLGKRKREGDEGYDAELERDRHLNDMKFKSRLEHIFSKYGRDFSDTGDEVDIFTGEIIVNNGHLQHMTTDHDLGGDRRGRLSEMLDADFSDTAEGEEEDDAEDEEGRFWSDGHADAGLAIDQDELAELNNTDQEGEEPGDELQNENIDVMSDDDFATDYEDEVGTVKARKDVWNDAPRLPGDVGYDPFAGVADQPGSSKNALKDFESGVSDQILQLVDALEKTQDMSELNSQATAGLKPQITIDLDPTSASYGKPVITYVPTGGQKRQIPAVAAAIGSSAELQRQSKLPTVEDVLKRPRDVAANVLSRIADAGLPTVPGPDGKFPTYRSRRHEAKGEFKGVSVDGGDTDMLDANQVAAVIDPFLEAETNIEAIVETAAEQEGSTRDTPESHYSANTARPLDKKLLPPGVPFTEEDDELILELKDNRGIGWEDIRDLCFQDRRITALQYRYYTYLKPDCHNEFTEEDDRLLLQLREEDCMSWPQIQRTYFSEYRVNQLQYRYYTRLCQNRKTPWTKEQDELLAELKDQQGLTWQQIKDRHFPNRTLGQVQYRYYKNGRPADWKEQIAALNEAFNQADEDGDDEAVSRTSGPKTKSAKHGTLVWSLRRRLAGASSKLTETKRSQQAEKKRKREERERLETLRLAAQEEKRKVREAQNIAKLNLIRAAQKASKSRPRLEGRDIASVSPEPEVQDPPSPYSLQSKPASLTHDDQPQSIKQQFDAAIARYEGYQNSRQRTTKRLGQRILAHEEEEKFRRQADRRLFQQAVQVGPMLLPRPPSTAPLPIAPKPADTAAKPPTSAQSSYRSPNPRPISERELHDGRAEQLAQSVTTPVDPNLLMPAQSFPRLDGSSDPTATAINCSRLPWTTNDTPLDASASTMLHGNTSEVASRVEAAPTGPVSRHWNLPKTHQPIAKERHPDSASMPPIGTFSTPRAFNKVKVATGSRQSTDISFPFPSRPPLPKARLFPARSVNNTVPTVNPSLVLSSAHSNIQDYNKHAFEDLGHGDDVDDGATISEVSSPTDRFEGDAVRSSESALVPLDAAKSNLATKEVVPGHAPDTIASADQTWGYIVLEVCTQRPVDATRSESNKPAILHDLSTTQPPSRPFKPVQRSAIDPKSIRPASRGRRPVKTRKGPVIEDSESEAPSSIMLLSGNSDLSEASDTGSLSESGSEDNSLRTSHHARRHVDASMTELDDSDDELIANGEPVEKRLLGLHTSLSLMETSKSREETPKKELPGKHPLNHRRSAPAKTLRDLAANSSNSRLTGTPADDDDELA